MEKVELRTADIAAENAAKLAELFPDIVTEVLDEDGGVRHSIDVEALKAHVGDIAEDKRERYQFTWPGKQRARAEAIRPIDKTMRPCVDESMNWDTTENLYIEGDNLDALKILRETYAGKIKMIYIDPPYNTGHDFIYKDSRKQSKEDMDVLSSIRDDEGNLMDQHYVLNSESRGTFHSDWCSMIYSRLLLAKDLLRGDGVIFISIDDAEVDNLRKICDEVFGEKNFIGQTVRVSSPTQNTAKFMSIMHDYCLVYCRDAVCNVGGWSVKKNNVEEFEARAKRLVASGLDESEVAKELRALTKYPRFYDFDHYTMCDSKGVYQLVSMGGVEKGNTSYTLIHPVTKRPCSMPQGGWRYKDSALDELVASDAIYYGDSEKNVPRKKLYLHDYLEQIPKGVFFFDTQSDVRFLKSSGIPFDFPKPVDYVSYFAEMIKLESDDIVLDFFSGSATTAHAVMQLNAEDGGSRKFIMVQLPEVCDEKSEAAKAGYKNICEIGKERIRRAGAKIAAEVEESNAQLKLGEEPRRVPDIGFRVLKIDSSNFEDVQRTPDTLCQDALFSLADNVKPGRTPEDILFQLFPKLEIPYTARIDTLDICGKTVYSVDDDTLVACLDREVPEDVVRAMAQREPAWAVLRDASFTGDDALANFEEIFKTLSPETKTRVV